MKASRQYGLISRLQALDLGMTPGEVRYQVRSRRWVRVLTGVYRVNGAPLSWRARLMACCLAAGPEAVVSHRSAAALWGLEGFEPPRTVDLTVPRGHRPRVPGARIHESLQYDLVGQRTRDGIPVTALPRTILDLCATARVEGIALRALDDVDRRKLVTWSGLWECLLLHTRRGRPGVLQVTWRRLKDNPAAVVREVKEALGQRYADQSSGLSSVY